MDTSHSILKSAKLFFAGTALSRMSGLIRDVAMAISFGAAPEIGAFMVAYRLANLLRRLFGEGNLQSGFVPHFETLRGADPKAAFAFYRDSAFSLSILLIGLIAAGEGFLWAILPRVSAQWGEIVELTMWMAPGLLFICLSALHTALLQCQKKYLAPAAAPALFNLVWVLFALFAIPFPLERGVRFLSFGVTLAFAAQWGATAIQVRKEVRSVLSREEWRRPHLFSPEWKKILRPMAFGILGIGAMQINSALDAVFARIADLSGPTYLWYSIRVQQLPLALFGIAISGALLPPLARAMRGGNTALYRELLSSSLRQAASLMVPCSFALFALGGSGLNLLYGRGHFSSGDLQETLYCLWAYGLGLIPASFVLLLAAGAYAQKSFGSPALASLISVGVHVALNAFLIFGLQLGPISIALATSGSAWLNCALLAKKQSIESGFFPYFLKVSAVSAAAAILTMSATIWVGDGSFDALQGVPFPFTRSFSQQIGQFALAATLYISSFLALAKLANLAEVFQVVGTFKK